MLVCSWHSFIKGVNTNIIHRTILLVKPDTRIGTARELTYILDFAIPDYFILLIIPRSSDTLICTGNIHTFHYYNP